MCGLYCVGSSSIPKRRRCHWESRPQEGGGIAQAWATWPEDASAPNSDVPGARSIRDGNTGNEDDNSFAGFCRSAQNGSMDESMKSGEPRHIWA